LREGYKEINELEKLAESCIDIIVKKNEPRVAPVFKWRIENPSYSEQAFYKFLQDHFIFGVPSVRIADAGKGGSGYTIIGEFIKQWDVTVNFTNSISSHGAYVALTGAKGGGKIFIKTDTKGFAELFGYGIDHAISRHKTPTASEMMKPFKLAAGSNFRTVLVHELQHAYDDWRSKGKYRTSKQAKDYQKQYGDNADIMSPGEVMWSAERWAKYAGMPHEYWARFTQTVRSLFMFPSAYDKAFPAIEKEFKREFPGYDKITDDDKKRLSKALYKYWDENRKKQ